MTSYQLHAIYVREMPQGNELETLTNGQLDLFCRTLQDELSLIQEETVAMTNYSQSRREAEAAKQAAAAAAAGSSGNMDEALSGTAVDASNAAAAAAGGGILLEGPGGGGGGVFDEGAVGMPSAGGGITAGTVGRRRGNKYRRKSSETKQLILNVDDKMSVVAEEHERVKKEMEEAKSSAVETRELMNATHTEAVNRINELALAATYFDRDVVKGDPATAMERLNSYVQDRPLYYERQLKKIVEKSTLIEQQLGKLKNQLDSAGDGGDKFIRIDFDQLKIENQQYDERLKDKDKELKQLKTTTTRTVQTLNSLTDKLSQLLSEQSNASRDLELRRAHCDKFEKELGQVRRDSGKSKNKNTSLKIQHESVKVPKVEDYIAQKAEEYELKKAVSNWRRKVEIARGHVHVAKQKARASKRESQMAAEARNSLLAPGGHNMRATVSSLQGGQQGGAELSGTVLSSQQQQQNVNNNNNNNSYSPNSATSASGSPANNNQSGRSHTSGVEAVPVPPPAAVSAGIRKRK